MRHFDEVVATEALCLWSGDARTLQHIATSGNSVYRFERGGEPFVLRLTDPAHRTAEENEGEIGFVRHLSAQGIAVAEPVASARGLFVERLPQCSASVFTWVDGEQVDWTSAHWNEGFFRAWGRTLARIHDAAARYEGPARWVWRDEGLLRDADLLLPRDDRMAREELALILSVIDGLPRTAETFGMIHADHAPQNFRYRPDAGIVSFDFGNCCLHWFAQDVAISLLYFRRDARREEFRRAFVASYREVRSLEGAPWEALEWFMRLRILYVYLSRLRAFGDTPGQEQRAILSNLRLAVEERFAWPEA